MFWWYKAKAPNTICEEKENLDPHVIPARKKKATAKKSHNLSMHVAACSEESANFNLFY